MSETVVVLTPDDGSQENVEGSDLGTPLNLETLLDPLAVLHMLLVRIYTWTPCSHTWLTMESITWMKGS